MGTEYFVRHPVIGVLSNLPVLIGALALLLLLSARFRSMLERRPVLWLLATFLGTRVVFAVLVVVVLGHVSLDLSIFFEGQARAVQQGGVPYRDFASSYAPFFPYLLAGATSLREGAGPIFAMFILFDAVAGLAVWKLARRENDAVAVRAAWLYVAAPVTWYFLVRYGQDETLAAAFLAVAVLLLGTGRDIAAAVCMGVGFACTKFTFGIFALPFALAARRPGLYVAVFLTTVVAAFLPFVLVGAPVWRPLVDESGVHGFGPSVWRLPALFGWLSTGWPVRIAAAGGVVGAVIWGMCARPRPTLERLVLLTGLVFLILSPKVMPMYVTPFWPAMCLWIARSLRPVDLWLATILNILLGMWWYLEAGGIIGNHGRIVQAVAILWTGAIPVVNTWLALRVARQSAPAPEVLGRSMVAPR